MNKITTEGMFERITQYDHECVAYFYDPYTGLKAIIAIHNTVLGPALGGTRMWPYTQEKDALQDVLRLSRAMTYKTALAGLDLGGGKAVILGDARLKTEAFLRRYGRCVDQLQGRYIAAPDVNTTIADMEQIAKETDHVACCSTLRGGSGDSAYLTAWGVYLGIKAAVKKRYGRDSLQGKKVGIEGVGKTGSQLVHFLCKEEAIVYITDVDTDKVAAVTQQYSSVQVVPGAIFYDQPFDIYAPCALGATLNDQTIPRLQCAIIAGAANNQLADETRHGQLLVEKDILYVPDFLVNAGGVINASTELDGSYNQQLAQQRTEQIYTTSLAVLTTSEQERIPPHQVAMSRAEQRIRQIQGMRRSYGN